MLRHRSRNAVSLLLIGCMAAAGCGAKTGEPASQSSSGGKEAAALASNEPVQLNFLYTNNNYDEIKDLIQAKFPQVTLVRMQELDKELAAGNVPDLLHISHQKAIPTDLIDKNMQYDLSELITKYKFNLNRIDPGLIEPIRIYSDGKLYGLPYVRATYALYYNKDIFDRFNVPYPPKDKPMTWDETVELAKRLTRTDGGVAYRGLSIDQPSILFNQLNIASLEASDNASRLQKDPNTKLFFQTFRDVLNITGNYPAEDRSKLLGKKSDDFIKERNIAMLPMWQLNGTFARAEQESGLNWDIAPLPVWPQQQPQYEANAENNMLAISSGSKHKDIAFQIIAYLLSDEVQKARNEQGTPTVLADKTIISTYGASNPALKSKNMQAYFIGKPAPGPAKVSKYESVAFSVVSSSFKEFAKSEKDVNTFIRDLDEKIAKKIAEETIKRK